jgi:hypothetical protein
MPEQRYGHIIVSGDATDLSIAAKAYAGQTQPKTIGEYLDSDFRIEGHTPAEFRARNLVVPGTKRLAWGHVIRKGLLFVNNGQQVRRQIYAYRHEPFHPLFAKNITKSKSEALQKLVVPVDGTVYQNRLSEVMCDAMVELFWGQGSVLDKFYGDIADKDLQQAFDILMGPSTEPPVITPPPIPLPLPDPEIAILTQKVVDLERVLGTIHELSAPEAA